MRCPTHVRPCLTTLILLLLAATALAQPTTPVELWRYQAIEDVNAFATLPDVDGDGRPDVVIEAYDAGASGDHLVLLSGGASGTPGVIWSVRPSSGVSDGGGDGQECLVVCDDLGSDGFPDVLVSTAWGNRSVHAVDGQTGQVLWTFDSYNEPESGWIYAVRTVPDRTGDGRPEVIFGTGSDGHRGYLLDGADGSIIWRFLGASDAIGYTEALPDMNGDEIADVLFCGWDNEHRVFCVSGAGSVAGAQIWSRDTGSSNYNATVIDDVTGDGIAEVVVGTWQASNQVVCLDGADGSTVWTFHNGSYNYIMRLVTTDDVDADGYRDIAVGSWSRGLPVISGRTGELIWMSYAGTLNGGDFWTVASVSDLDGDGIGEVAGGSFDGLVYLFAGADGDTLWTFDTGHRLFAVAGAPDLDGNGTDDVLGGTQYLSSGGRAYALQGGDDATAVPELPEAAGLAARNGPVVTLAWSLTSPLPLRGGSPHRRRGWREGRGGVAGTGAGVRHRRTGHPRGAGPTPGRQGGRHIDGPADAGAAGARGAGQRRLGLCVHRPGRPGRRCALPRRRGPARRPRGHRARARAHGRGRAAPRAAAGPGGPQPVQPHDRPAAQPRPRRHGHRRHPRRSRPPRRQARAPGHAGRRRCPALDGRRAGWPRSAGGCVRAPGQCGWAGLDGQGGAGALARSWSGSADQGQLLALDPVVGAELDEVGSRGHGPASVVAAVPGPSIRAGGQHRPGL